MRVLVTTTPLAGHINPLWRYAEGLKRAGHEVRFAASEEARAAVQKRGFELFPVADASKEDSARVWAMLDACTAEEAIEIGVREAFGGIKSRAALPGVREAIAAWKPDLVFRESMEFAGLVAAEEAGVPSAAMSILANGVMQMHADCFQETADLLREFAGHSGQTGRTEMVFSDFPESLDNGGLIFGVAPIRIAPSAPAKTPVSGDERWLPEAGEPFVYVTFGTVSGRSDKAKAAYKLAVRVVSDLPVRALLTTGPIMDPALLEPIPANVIVEPFVPQTDVFTCAHAVVHHGGSGTFLGAMAAGLPQVVVPLFADQPENARALDATGAGVAVFDREDDVLHAAILRALDDAEMRRKAEALAEEMAGMAPMSDAVEALERHARKIGARMVSGGLIAPA